MVDPFSIYRAAELLAERFDGAISRLASVILFSVGCHAFLVWWIIESLKRKRP
jgi:hypothetical protein